MYQSIYYIDKTSNTPGDTLAAYGLARLLYFILSASDYTGKKTIKIRDEYAAPLCQYRKRVKLRW